MRIKFKTVNEYFAAVPAAAKKNLQDLRKIIGQTAPEAEEVISYNIPAFRWKGILVWYAGYKKHIGLYPASSAVKFFKNELKSYKTSKGAIQFPVGKTIPASLVKKIVKYRMNENSEKERSRVRRILN